MKPLIETFIFCLFALPLIPEDTPKPAITQETSPTSECLGIYHIEAEHIEFNEKTIHLVGTVNVIHEFGVIQCQEATLFLQQDKKTNEALPVTHISLKENIRIDFSKNTRLLAEEGEINCITLQGTFLSPPPKKVVYLAYQEEGSVPLKATSSSLQALITKSSHGYELSSLKGEGSVHVECLSKDDFQNEYQKR